MWRPRFLLSVAYALFAAAAIGVGVATYVEPRSHFLTVFGPNLAPDALGILIGLVLVERIVRLQRQRELEPLRIRARQMIAIHVSYLVKLLAEMYKATVVPPAPPGSGREIPVETADQLVDAWRTAVGRFNAMASAPSPHAALTWAEYIAGWTAAIIGGIEPVLDRYAEALGIEAVATIEDVINGPDFRGWFREAANTLVSARQTAFHRPVYLPFGSPDELTIAAMDDLARRLKALFTLFGDNGGKYLVTSMLWTHMPPDWASARYDGQLDQSLVPIRVTVLPKSPSAGDMADAGIPPLDFGE
jgi:hypothetical protein